MKTTIFNNKVTLVLNWLFWLLSFNAFNLFFTRGVESGYELDEFALPLWCILLTTNFLLIFITMHFVWFSKWIRKWIKWVISGIILIIWGNILFDHFGLKNMVIPLFLVYFTNDFLYVLIFHLTIIAAVYLNIKILIKKFIFKGKFVYYLISALGLAIIAAVLNYALFDWVIDLLFPKLFFLSWFKITELVMIMVSYLAVTTIVYLLWQYALTLLSGKEKIQNELFALKAQINPHFLFNNLNTIYSMAEKGDPRTKDVILELSDFLRYVLYDTSSEKIPLEKEIEIIKTYVDLQKERINSVTEIILNIQGNFSGTIIAPLLLLPLIENCFKHGLGQTKGTIKIEIEYSNGQLHLITWNKIVHREILANQKQGGIGINNVEKRLNLLYPGKHLLKFDKEGDFFATDLKIDLH
jgi:sensor histidine kinase YesM